MDRTVSRKYEAAVSASHPKGYVDTPKAETRITSDYGKDVVNSSGNVFIDLGYPPDEAAILQMRADLMADLRKFIKTKRLTQAKAAKILGVSQSRVSDLMSRQMGKI